MATIADSLPEGARGLISFRGREAKALGLTADTPDDTDFLTLIAAHPRLLRRPIIVGLQGVLVGFSLKKLEALFGSGAT